MDPERLLGQQLGPYYIEAILGRGGMAVVYRARRDSDTPVALKVLFPPPAAGAEIRARFGREARTAARLRHPAIVRVLDTGQADGLAGMAMALIEGESLADRLAQANAPPFDELAAADIAWQKRYRSDFKPARRCPRPWPNSATRPAPSSSWRRLNANTHPLTCSYPNRCSACRFVQFTDARSLSCRHASQDRYCHCLAPSVTDGYLHLHAGYCSSDPTANGHAGPADPNPHLPPALGPRPG